MYRFDTVRLDDVVMPYSLKLVVLVPSHGIRLDLSLSKRFLPLVDPPRHLVVGDQPKKDRPGQSLVRVASHIVSEGLTLTLSHLLENSLHRFPLRLLPGQAAEAFHVRVVLWRRLESRAKLPHLYFCYHYREL